ncbi:hypothetical protein [Benzoatithermus flavus]|jgi:hypothetical protein|uniref:Uncharacterized protein n=1 Tax=Benzoatithermus flavus TaxID=3108223 RepID=A0ABU8XXV0_9PROT
MSPTADQKTSPDGAPIGITGSHALEAVDRAILDPLSGIGGRREVERRSRRAPHARPRLGRTARLRTEAERAGSGARGSRP